VDDQSAPPNTAAGRASAFNPKRVAAAANRPAVEPEAPAKKPRSRRKFVFGATVEGSYGDLREKPGLGFSSLISNVWDTQYGSFGALLSYGESDLYSEAYGSHLTDFTYRSDLSNGEDRRYVPRGGAVRMVPFGSGGAATSAAGCAWRGAARRRSAVPLAIASAGQALRHPQRTRPHHPRP
jgi:hypothetical protein